MVCYWRNFLRTKSLYGLYLIWGLGRDRRDIFSEYLSVIQLGEGGEPDVFLCVKKYLWLFSSSTNNGIMELMEVRVWFPLRLLSLFGFWAPGPSKPLHEGIRQQNVCRSTEPPEITRKGSILASCNKEEMLYSINILQGFFFFKVTP